MAPRRASASPRPLSPPDVHAWTWDSIISMTRPMNAVHVAFMSTVGPRCVISPISASRARTDTDGGANLATRRGQDESTHMHATACARACTPDRARA